jgi:hypothetical protein
MFRGAFAKLRAHFHRQPPRHIFTTREVGSLSGVRVHLASVLRDVSPFRDPPHLTNESGLALPDQRSWLVVFRLAGRRRLHVFSFENLASRSESCFTWLPAKLLAHFHRQPRDTSLLAEKLALYPACRSILRPCCVTSLLSKIHHTSQTNLASHFQTSEAGSSCSACWSKTFARLHFQELSVSRSARRFTRWLSSNACASSPSSALHLSLIENRWVPFPGTARASCARNVHRLFFRRRITHHKRICVRSTEPARLPRLLAAKRKLWVSG